MIAEALWSGAPGHKEPLKARHDVVLQAAQQAVGKRLAPGRRKEDVLIRVFVAYQLRQEGYSYEAIGEAMNRDHATVIHYVRKKMGDMLSLPSMYRDELKMYNKIKNILGA